MRPVTGSLSLHLDPPQPGKLPRTVSGGGGADPPDDALFWLHRRYYLREEFPPAAPDIDSNTDPPPFGFIDFYKLYMFRDHY